MSKPTLYRWLRESEAKGVAALLPKRFANAGKPRVKITRAWDKGCGLPEEVQDAIAAKLAATARGLIQNNRSEREVVRLCGFELRRLTEDAGSPVSGRRLAEVCKLNVKFAKRFRDMRIVHAFDQDHKRFTDRHEFHVKRGLTARPMQALMGDVHTIDLTISEAISSSEKKTRLAGYEAIVSGKQKVKAWLIAWMDCSSGYIWATPVLTRGNQGISQRDVANSLYEVVTCPWGGMPETFIIDNGGEYGFISECVTRFAAMADLSNLNVIRCQPYHPEGKARLEGAFQIIEERFLSHLPGYHGGNHLNPRLSGRGKAVAPYDRAPEQLLHDLKLAIAQYNGTPQHGDLKGLSPKAMLEEKAVQTGWQAAQIDPADPIMFDLVFSDEIRRDVKQGHVSIKNKLFSAPIMAELIGEKQVPILVPWRDPNADPILFRGGVIHRLTCKEHGVTDGSGSQHRSEMTALQRKEIERRRAQADQDVDVQALLSQAADLSPVQHNAPETWSFGHIDKGEFLGAPITEEEAREREDAKARAVIEELLAFSRPERREAGGGNRPTSLDAT
ncbi:hypothetical protein [Roseinatronobacter sp.]|uniref:hypothetical protein n=1 Tax=Roseinatronobacter sp. TaxID=1945755 RepID=UPI0025DBE8B6|nr:hypothetical protein [Roseibaca sp.]